MENEIFNNNETVDNSPKLNASSGTGVMGSLIFMVIMIIFMAVLANFMH